MCTKGQVCSLGQVVDGEIRLSPVGRAAERYWTEIPAHFKSAGLDEFVVMPNHVHGIVAIHGDRMRDADRARPTSRENIASQRGVETRDLVSLQTRSSISRQSVGKFGPLTPGSFPAIIQAYKSTVTRWCRENGDASFCWQPRFYDQYHPQRSKLAEDSRVHRQQSSEVGTGQILPSQQSWPALNAEALPLTPLGRWSIMPST